MLKSVILLALSSISIYYSHRYTRGKLHISSPDTQAYFSAVQLMNNALAEATDLDQHHFKPCRDCGYELALVKDVGYCRISDTYKLLHPNVVLKDLVVFRDYGGKDLARKIMRETMFDGNPRFEQVRQFDPHNESIFHSLPLSTSVLYPYAKNYYRTHTPGYASGCLFQKYYHVPGQEELCLKSNQSTHFRNYIRDLERKGKSPQCVEDAKYMKKTYRLWDKKECQEIFELMATPEYVNHLRKKGIQHIFKTNMHLGNGILLVDFNNERAIRKWYENGTKCGMNLTKNIIQEYVLNPYLYNVLI